MRQDMSNKMLIISAPSGTGKTTVVKKFLEIESNWTRVTTTTTRSPRIDESNTDYHFVSKERFATLVSQNAFVEYAFVFGNGYGTPRNDIFTAWASHKGVVLIVDVQGKKHIKTFFPDAITVFLMPPSEEEQERRIRKRGTELEDEIRRRLDEAEREMQEAITYDYVLTNNVSEDTARRLSEIVKGIINPTPK